MKHFLLSLSFVLMALFVHGQQDSTTVWISTASGNIFKLNINDCTSQLYCSTGKLFYDIALTPDGNLWGNTQDTLYQIYPNGSTRVVGKIPPTAALVGLDDSTLLINSMTYLVAIKTANASADTIGSVGYNADGDLTWLGKNLYMFGGGLLVKIIMNDDYSNIIAVETKLPDSSFYTPGLTTAYINNVGYSLISFPGNVEIYKIDTSSGNYQEICNSPPTDTAFGASSMVFPPQQAHPVSIQPIINGKNQFDIYPNPVHDKLIISCNEMTEEYKVVISDLIGRVVYANQTKNPTIVIDTKSLLDGVYVVKIYSKCDEALQLTKILKR